MSVDLQPIHHDWVEPPDDPAQNERVSRTLDMAREFLQNLFDDPSLIDEIPEGANVIFIPDDAEVAAEHRAAGEAMQAAGHLVHFVRVPLASNPI